MEYASYAVGGIFGVLWYLLKQKDAAQADEIKTLYALHREDSEKLTTLQLKIAENHYPKHELDTKFLSLEAATKEGFAQIGVKIDKLSTALISHITEESK